MFTIKLITLKFIMFVVCSSAFAASFYSPEKEEFRNTYLNKRVEIEKVLKNNIELLSQIAFNPTKEQKDTYQDLAVLDIFAHFYALFDLFGELIARKKQALAVEQLNIQSNNTMSEDRLILIQYILNDLNSWGSRHG